TAIQPKKGKAIWPLDRWSAGRIRTGSMEPFCCVQWLQISRRTVGKGLSLRRSQTGGDLAVDCRYELEKRIYRSCKRCSSTRRKQLLWSGKRRDGAYRFVDDQLVC